MSKPKKLINLKPDSDHKAAIIVLLMFVAGILLFSFFKSREHPTEKPPVLTKKAEVMVKKVKTVKPVSVRKAPQPFNIPGSGGKIAFIIDDWGQSAANCKYLKEIPDPLAVSILPGLRHTKDIAACAAQYHKMAMLHLPLEALYNADFYPPDYIITTSMKPALVNKIVDEDMAQLPSIEGVNNHMGSKATEDRALMKLIFKKVKKKGLFFVDSMTAHNTVCAGLAEEMDMAFGKRDVFLDNINTKEAITKQLVSLAQLARRRGYAVAIGHDRSLTMQVLKEQIPLLKAQGFQIVSVKELLTQK